MAVAKRFQLTAAAPRRPLEGRAFAETGEAGPALLAHLGRGDATPTGLEMSRAVGGRMKVLGLEGHEALVVAHEDGGEAAQGRAPAVALDRGLRAVTGPDPVREACQGQRATPGGQGGDSPPVGPAASLGALPPLGRFLVKDRVQNRTRRGAAGDHPTVPHRGLTAPPRPPSGQGTARQSSKTSPSTPVRTGKGSGREARLQKWRTRISPSAPCAAFRIWRSASDASIAASGRSGGVFCRLSLARESARAAFLAVYFRKAAALASAAPGSVAAAMAARAATLARARAMIMRCANGALAFSAAASASASASRRASAASDARRNAASAAA